MKNLRYPGSYLQRIFIDGDKLKAFEYDVIPDHKIAVPAKYVNCQWKPDKWYPNFLDSPDLMTTDFS